MEREIPDARVLRQILLEFAHNSQQQYRLLMSNLTTGSRESRENDSRDSREIAQGSREIAEGSRESRENAERSTPDSASSAAIPESQQRSDTTRARRKTARTPKHQSFANEVTERPPFMCTDLLKILEDTIDSVLDQQDSAADAEAFMVYRDHPSSWPQAGWGWGPAPRGTKSRGRGKGKAKGKGKTKKGKGRDDNNQEEQADRPAEQPNSDLPETASSAVYLGPPSSRSSGASERPLPKAMPKQAPAPPADALPGNTSGEEARQADGEEQAAPAKDRRDRHKKSKRDRGESCYTVSEHEDRKKRREERKREERRRDEKKRDDRRREERRPKTREEHEEQPTPGAASSGQVRNTKVAVHSPLSVTNAGCTKMPTVVVYDTTPGLWGLADTACSRSCMGDTRLPAVEAELDQHGMAIEVSKRKKRKYGGLGGATSYYAIYLPFRVALSDGLYVDGKLEVSVLHQSNCPLLVSYDALAFMGAAIDCEARSVFFKHHGAWAQAGTLASMRLLALNLGSWTNKAFAYTARDDLTWRTSADGPLLFETDDEAGKPEQAGNEGQDEGKETVKEEPSPAPAQTGKPDEDPEITISGETIKVEAGAVDPPSDDDHTKEAWYTTGLYEAMDSTVVLMQPSWIQSEYVTVLEILATKTRRKTRTFYVPGGKVVVKGRARDTKVHVQPTMTNWRKSSMVRNTDGQRTQVEARSAMDEVWKAKEILDCVVIFLASPSPSDGPLLSTLVLQQQDNEEAIVAHMAITNWSIGRNKPQ